MLLRYFFEGIVLGATLFPSCVLTCGPVYIPFILTREEKGLRGGFTLLLKLMGSRFLAYIISGVVAGMVGGEIPERARTIATYIALVVLSILLFYNSLKAPIIHGCSSRFLGKAVRSPYIIGFLTGLNLCPPFLIALTEAARSAGAISGGLLFVGLAISSTILFVPLAFLNISKGMKTIVRFGQVLGVLMAFYFFAIGSSGLILDFVPKSNSRDYTVLSVTDADTLYTLTTGSAIDTLLAHQLKENFKKPVIIENITEIGKRKHSVIFIHNGFNEKEVKKLSYGGNLVILFPLENKDVSDAVAFLKEYAFKVDTLDGAFWDAKK